MIADRFLQVARLATYTAEHAASSRPIQALIRWRMKTLTLTLTLQRGVTGTARMLHALTHSSISRQV